MNGNGINEENLLQNSKSSIGLRLNVTRSCSALVFTFNKLFSKLDRLETF